MSEWREGTPTQEGWYRCEAAWPGENAIKCYWFSKGEFWEMEDRRLLVTRKIFRFQGPLVILPEPSQGASTTARQRAEFIYGHTQAWAKDLGLIERQITAAEQAAREAEKAKWVKACKVETDNRENNPIRVATALGIRMRAEGHAIDQPAQPAEQETPEPSQGARGILEEAWRQCHWHSQSTFIESLLPFVTAAEQAAFQRGREEGRREERVRCVEICYNERREYEENAKKCDQGGNTFGGTMDTHGALTCTRIAEEILATDQPAQPAEPKTIVESFLQDPDQRRQFESEKERYFHDWLTDLEQRVLRLEGKS